MFNKLKHKLNAFLEHPLYPIQAILMLCSIGATIFALTEKTENGNITIANYGIAILLLLLTFTPLKKNVTELSFFFIASFNLLNISIIHFSNFETKYYFQYIIFFLLSSLLVNSSKTFLYNLITNLIGIIIISIAHGNYASIFEFHANLFSALFRGVLLGANCCIVDLDSQFL